MTTFDPDTQAQDPAVLRDLVSRFGGRFALDCFVIQGGEIVVGQAVHLAPPGDGFTAVSHGDASGISRSESASPAKGA
jgi:hypothetical protein